ncbi:hypothetical protein F3N42_03625 [Marinihelvus fidelis]|uniref:Uncharacterized protein n=1 Tax=Marinihelvus fidelis TaxID=2613842 RepID=A0A5N0TEJ5_9GAMM|nr:hypothetical protein [Marinihelvus fidelis]KAA9133452.1 hypothetical protein F3N42_03625 [Marinihelvus fidelis]
MADYPGYAISRDSSATPDAGILTDLAEDLTIKQRRDAAGTRYRITIIEEWISLTEFAALVAAFEASLGPYDLTLHGLDYVVNFVGEPYVIERRGQRVRVQCELIGTKATP